jgi:hypothetical protein
LELQILLTTEVGLINLQIHTHPLQVMEFMQLMEIEALAVRLLVALEFPLFLAVMAALEREQKAVVVAVLGGQMGREAVAGRV